MSGLFGIFRRDGAPVQPETLDTMRRAMQHWGPHGGATWQDGPAGLGQLRLFTTPEADLEDFPRLEAGIAFTVAGRVDNRAELISACGLPASTSLPDGDLIFQAYRKWGIECVEQIYGDWAFAAWRPLERRLDLARDHFGNTSLYYYADARVFAFASDARALLALHLSPIEMDELYLAQVLISWPAYHGERVIQKPLKRLPPAHCLTVTPDRLDVRQYWDMRAVSALRLPRREDYVEAFLEKFDQAVQTRLRFHPKYGGVASKLSGGLDSGSVTATAAMLLRPTGGRVSAYTSVPVYDTGKFVGQHFGDEWPLARATAQFSGNVDHYPVAASRLTPIAAIRQALPILQEPAHAAGNMFWGLELNQATQADGHAVLLSGQLGNAGISWTGDIFSQPLDFQIKTLGLVQWSKANLKRVTPSRWLAAWHAWRTPADWFRGSSIHPDFARRLNLLERRLADLQEINFPSALDLRFGILKPGRTFIGAFHAQMGAAAGIEIRDPSGDTHLLNFCLALPDHIFMDPATGADRWLIRAAMQGRLPDEVRLNSKRGIQAGDLAPRLRACAEEVEAALDELARGPAAVYVDVAYMRQVWNLIQTEDSPQAHGKSTIVLTRGIMAGLFVNAF